MKSFTTLAGARRYRREIGGSIIRILADPDDIFVVTPSLLNTRIMSVADDGHCDGSIKLIDLSTGAAA
jgi:ribulose-5-phosphate 4-epimerase/fuculose-1-phosphate aldolase